MAELESELHPSSTVVPQRLSDEREPVGAVVRTDAATLSGCLPHHSSSLRPPTLPAMFVQMEVEAAGAAGSSATAAEAAPAAAAAADRPAAAAAALTGAGQQPAPAAATAAAAATEEDEEAQEYEEQLEAGPGRWAALSIEQRFQQLLPPLQGQRCMALQVGMAPDRRANLLSTLAPQQRAQLLRGTSLQYNTNRLRTLPLT